MLHDDICEAVDAIDDHRRQISEIASDATKGPSPELLDMLRQMLIATAKIMKAFHHTFDFPINADSMTEVDEDLMTWAASYDKGFASAYNVLLRYS